MKKAIYLIIALIGLSAPSCSDSMLDFSPTDSGSGKELLKSASTAITSVNGVYRSMWTAGWSTTANTHQCFGIAAYNLALDCMADDLIMQSQGNGWFWGDHCYNVKSNYTSSAFRSYDVWYANYKWIANVNYIIDAEPEMAGTEADVAYVAGQAYAIRALCYLNLATWFSRAPYNSLTGASRWNEPCVPVYTTGTSIDTGGQPRESLRTVYGRIDQDIDRAIELLEKARETTLAENNKSHINLYVALGIKSRACLAEGDWDGAFKAAKRVIDEGGYAVGTKSDLTSGMNSLDKQNVMWGAGIQVADQAGGYAGFFTHMDNKDGAEADQQTALQPHQRDRHPPRLVGPLGQGVALRQQKILVRQRGLLPGRLHLHARRGDVLHGRRSGPAAGRPQERTRTDEHRHGRTRPGLQRQQPQRHAARRDDHDLDRIVPRKHPHPPPHRTVG